MLQMRRLVGFTLIYSDKVNALLMLVVQIENCELLQLVEYPSFKENNKPFFFGVNPFILSARST